MNRNENRNPIANLKKQHLLILWYVYKKYNVSSIAKELGKSISTISEQLKYLKEREYIEIEVKSNITIYKLKKRGEDAISVLLTTYEGKDSIILDRSHNIKLKSEIIRFPKAWGNEWKGKQMKNWTEYSKYIGDVLVIRTTSNILFQLPEIYYKTSDDALLETGRLVNRIIGDLEIEYEGLKIGTPKKISHIITQHHAIPDDPFARILADKKVTYKDDRLMIDHSKGKIEKEFIHPIYSPEDWENEIKHIKDHIHNNPPTSSELAIAIMQVTENQKLFDRNIEKHFEVLNRIGFAVDNLASKVESLGERKKEALFSKIKRYFKKDEK